MKYHVSIHGNDRNIGSAEKPLKTISQAARLAQPGDSVKVHSGLYREWINPTNSGTQSHPIVYEAAGDGEVVISGAEQVENWTEEGNGVWKCVVPNSLFVHRNPFGTELYGDWLFEAGFGYHLGEVYLNGKSLYESRTIDGVTNPEICSQAIYPEESKYKWYSIVEKDVTIIWANFGDQDPRKSLVEINVRPHCFWPKKNGINYITVRGFIMKQAATQWAPPTALQEGLIGPHWSKGWIIENNTISDSKCVGISLGKEIKTGDNEWSNLKYKFGTQREREVIFRACRENWKKDEIGSHIVRNNTIYNCEQAGIVGHLGGAFCQIYQNNIFDIYHKRLIAGAEIAGIKLHAAIDTQIFQNTIHGSFRGIWLDWQAQGTRISQNLLYENSSEDLFVEVSHGPYIVDNNLFLSPINFRNMAQGGAFVHNLFTGKFFVCPDNGRYTPYHFPHDTAVAGVMSIMGGDDRYYNNIFLGDDDPSNEPVPVLFFDNVAKIKDATENQKAIKKIDGVPNTLLCYLHPVGLSVYNSYPSGQERPWESPPKDGENPDERKLSVYISGNIYLNNAVPSAHEPNAKRYSQKGILVSKEDEKIKIKILNPELLRGVAAQQINTEILGKGFQAEMFYEAPDGTAYEFNIDFFGNSHSKGTLSPGPFALDSDLQKEFVL